MKGTITYKRDFSGMKTGQLMLIDIGGNSRSEHGQILDMAAEWNVDSNLNNEGVHSRCNDTVCTMNDSVIVGDGTRFGYGMCAGNVLWSYIHVHGGTLVVPLTSTEYVTATSVPRLARIQTTL